MYRSGDLCQYRLGDVAVNTVVVNTESPFSVNDTVSMDINEQNYVVTFPEVLKLSDRDVNTIKNVFNLYHKNLTRKPATSLL